MPRRIEVFDNSHIQGTNAVGAMIVAGATGFVKNQYRKFNIKAADLAPGDDYAMMREVLTRRFKRLVLDEAEAPGAEPLSGPAAAPRLPPTGLASRIEAPQPPPIDRRGGSAIAFGVLRADATVDRRRAGAGDARSQCSRRRSLTDDEFPNRPDLVLIDGGLGQLGIARQVLEDLGIRDVALIGVAKGPDRDAGREHFHTPTATGR